MADATLEMKEATEKATQAAKEATQVSKDSLEFNKIVRNNQIQYEKDRKNSYRLLIYNDLFKVYRFTRKVNNIQTQSELISQLTVILEEGKKLPIGPNVTNDQLVEAFNNHAELYIIQNVWESIKSYKSEFFEVSYNFNDYQNFFDATKELYNIFITTILVFLEKELTEKK